ncbi:MAG TPA: MMPL family transporter [Pseudogracilibacillus sp.]|nr:MMPL family transporter [Pseudogracilibacillus sp.]
MLKPFRSLARFSASSKGAKIILLAWIVAVVTFSLLAPSAKEYDANSKEGSVQGNKASEVAKEVLDKEFPTDEGMPALLVFYDEGKLTDTHREKITELSEWFESEDKPDYVASALPYHMFPEEIQDQMYSEDGTTLIFNIAMEDGIESNEANEALDEIRKKVSSIGLEDLQFEITGPAGISADTIALFQNADFVLMLATIALIFIILIVIYRSPLLAITPLIIAGIVYGVVDRILGLAGKNQWFPVDGSAVSIMLVLLFAVLTDYSLFVFSRYREELRKRESKYESMDEAIYHVSEPIFFSGGTVLLAMLTLFATIFEPYNHFAPVFSVAVVVILLAGLTLIPSIFALMGRKAFWPFIPKVEEKVEKKKGFWFRVSRFVMKRPAMSASVLLLVLLLGVVNLTTMKFNFNLMNSFPEDISSRQGFEILADHYPPGQLAPVDVILESDKEIVIDESFVENINSLNETLVNMEGVDTVSPLLDETVLHGDAELPRNFLSEEAGAVKMQLVLDGNPYDKESLEIVEQLRDNSNSLLEVSGFSPDDFTLHYAGQTAEQVDVQEMNKRDMIVLFSLVIVLLTIVLGIQTRSVVLPLIMMFTILLSYTASLGFGWFIFEKFLAYDAISYRLPVYTFIFMVALGIDYNIILVSRIRELAKTLPWKEAVAEAVSLTGGVIASAGLILAATFGVLMTQPLQELFLFGFTMALGILLTTFLIATVFLPAILILTGKNK